MYTNAYPNYVRRHHDTDDPQRPPYDRECDYFAGTASQRAECHRPRRRRTTPQSDPIGPPRRRHVVGQDFSGISDCNIFHDDDERRRQCYTYKRTEPKPQQPVKTRLDFTGVSDCDRITDKHYQRLCNMDPNRKHRTSEVHHQTVPVVGKRYDFSGFKGDCHTIADKAYVERCLEQQRNTNDVELAVDYTEIDCDTIQNEPYITQCRNSKKHNNMKRPRW